jgi:hypothetical protein
MCGITHNTQPQHNTHITTTSDASDGNTSKDEGNLTPNFVLITRDIQNQASCCVRAASTEAQHFRKFFGMSVRVVKILWDLLVRGNLRPEKRRPEHLLWVLFFLEGVPQAEPGVLGRWRACWRR